MTFTTTKLKLPTNPKKKNEHRNRNLFTYACTVTYTHTHTPPPLCIYPSIMLYLYMYWCGLTSLLAKCINFLCALPAPGNNLRPLRNYVVHAEQVSLCQDLILPGNLTEYLMRNLLQQKRAFFGLAVVQLYMLFIENRIKFR